MGEAGPYIAKTSDDRARQALEWNPQDKRGRGTSRNTWRRTVLEEAKGAKKTWVEIKTDAKSRVRQRILVEDHFPRRNDAMLYVCVCVCVCVCV